MTHYVLKAEAGRINISSPTFHAYAQDYLRCARGFVPTKNWSPVPYALLCRAIELELKSRHLENATQREVKKRYKHDLIKAYRAIPSNGQILSDEEVDLLQLTNAIYNDEKGFEYIQPKDFATGFSRFPDLQKLEAIAEKLIGSSPY